LGEDRLILLPGNWPAMEQPLTVAVSQDSTSLCLSPLGLSMNNAGSEDLRVIVNDYSRPQFGR